MMYFSCLHVKGLIFGFPNSIFVVSVLQLVIYKTFPIVEPKSFVMKKFLLLTLALCLGFGLFAQRVVVPQRLQDIGMQSKTATAETYNLTKIVNPSVDAGMAIDEAVMGTTTYDLQSNTCPQNRIYYFPDGTIGGVWTRGMNPSAFDDRGTGYNFFDGQDWGPDPSSRIEGERTGWPSYAPWGENGEVAIAHSGGAAGLVLSARSQKGEGDWNYSYLVGPEGNPDLLWPRMVTAGENHEVIHVFGLTPPEANGGNLHEGMDGALLYSRSVDGGATWEIENLLPDGMTAAEYTGFSGDTYVWAEPQGDELAFLVSDNWVDMFLMRSSDGGDTWTKTVIWEHPYPLFNDEPTDTFYCPDGATHAAFDNEGMLHVVFGVNRAHSDGSGTFWFPFVDGVAYWNESMPPFESDNFKTTLHPDSLFESGHLIGWSQDVDNNGSLDFLEGGSEVLGTYYMSLSSMPQLTIGANNKMALLFSSVTEGFDNGEQQYRHIWARAAADGVNWADFHDLTSDIIHIFDESIQPSVAANNDENFYFLFQADEEPGLAVRGDEDDYTENRITFMKVPFADVVGVNEAVSVMQFTVSQNYPNPFTDVTNIQLELRQSAQVRMEVMDLTGRIVQQIDYATMNAGRHLIQLQRENMNPGVYFYTLQVDQQQYTRKLIVQ